MLKRIAVSGLLGGVVLCLWTFIIDGLLGFNSRISMKQIPHERQVYDVLKENIIEPGRYACNPGLTASGMFPENEPVFSVQYSGIGHESAGVELLCNLVIFFLAPTIAASMLSGTSVRIISSYWRKVFFFAAVGLLFAIFGDLRNFGIGGSPLSHTLMFAVRSIMSWTIVGFVVAWQMRPEAGSSMNS